MGKKKIEIICLIFLLSIFSTINSFPQKMITKDLKWKLCDSIDTRVFKDTNQIIEWGKKLLPFPNTHLEDIQIKNSRFKILTVIGCSGLPYLQINVFKKDSSLWKFIMYSNVRLTEILLIEVDNKEEKVIFKTKSCQIGELPFQVLLSSEKAVLE